MRLEGEGSQRVGGWEQTLQSGGPGGFTALLRLLPGAKHAPLGAQRAPAGPGLRLAGAAPAGPAASASEVSLAQPGCGSSSWQQASME